MCQSRQLTIKALGTSLLILRSSACKCTNASVRSGHTAQSSRTDRNVECIGVFVPECLPAETAAKFLL